MIDVIGALLIIVTAILADKASEKWKKWCWTLFVVLVLAQAGLQIHGKREDEKKAVSQHDDIQNLMGELHKSETQRQVDNAILRTKLEDYAGLAQLGPALMKLAETSANFQKKQYEAKVVSDHDLYDLSMKTVKKLRDFSDKYEQLGRQQFMSFPTPGSMSDAERQKKWADDTNKTIQLYYAKQSEFQSAILPDAIYVRNELQKRKVPEPPLDPAQLSTVNMVLGGMLAGPYPEMKLATYLELWAKPLAGK